MDGKMKLRISVYEQARRIAAKRGRKCGLTPEQAEDVASEAYLAQARERIGRLETPRDANALVQTLARRGVADALRRQKAQSRTSPSDTGISLDDPDVHLILSDGGRGAFSIRRSADELPEGGREVPLPLWQRMVRETFDHLPGDLKRLARAYQTLWRAEDVRRKLKMDVWKFYRLQKKLKKSFEPSWLELRACRAARKRASKC